MIGISTRSFNPNVKARLQAAQSRAGLPIDPVLAFDEYLRFGKESRALGVTTDTAGGVLVAQEFSDRLWMLLKKSDPLWDPDVVTVIETATGAPFAVPLLDDTVATAEIIPENTISTFADLGAFDQLLLPTAPTWRAPMVKVSLELLQDSAYDFGELLANAFAARFQRGIGASLMTALSNDAQLGVTAAAAAISVDNLQDLYRSVNREYFKSPKFGWLMSHATLVAIRKIEQGNVRVIPSVREPATGRPLIFDVPVIISPSVPSIGTGNRSVFLGDLGYFIVRRVANSVRIRRFDERFADELAVAFTAYLRMNGGLARPAASDSPVKYLEHA